MQKTQHYENVLTEVLHFFSGQIQKAYAAGIDDVIVDPGFGFGKTLSHNYTLLKNLERFQEFQSPIMMGVSRKSMIYKLLESSPEEALNGTTALHSVGLQKGAHLLRVHDVKYAKECITLWHALQ
jgi:dihydropteroate synthase